jgi:glycosyltransferase involved in cell wall biosynthesis
MHIVLDISRLLGLAWQGQPSGVDRVEIAHARHWRSRPAEAVTFVAQSPWGWFAALPDGLARSLLAEADAVVAPGKEGGLARFRTMVAAAISRKLWGGGRWDLEGRVRARPDSIFLVVSHRAVHREAAVAGVVAAGARFVPLIHDMIPLTHPEYVRPFSTEQHAGRLQVIARMASGVLATTQAVARDLDREMARAGLALPPVERVGLGLDLPAGAGAAPVAPSGRPYFLMLGTVEPRKNHLLMLQIWREFARQGRVDVPQLLIVGRRGWENDAVFRMLERTDFAGLVEERGRLSDPEVERLLRGAVALLAPSFTEGFGIPLAEALACGTPVIASDIPAAREVGAGVPEHLHPLDFAGWREAVLDYADPASPRRAAQLARLAAWRQPRWEDHFQGTERFLDRLCGRAPLPGPVAAARARLLQE